MAKRDNGDYINRITNSSLSANLQFNTKPYHAAKTRPSRLFLCPKEVRKTTSEELNVAIYNKMNEEQAIYTDRLLTLPPEQILQHAYEYTVRQDILFAMEYTGLQPKQGEALLKSPCPIAEALMDFEKLETGYVDTIRACVEGRADKIIRLEKQKDAGRLL